MGVQEACSWLEMGFLELSRALGINEFFYEKSIKKDNIFLRYGPEYHNTEKYFFQRETALRNNQQNKSQFQDGESQLGQVK